MNQELAHVADVEHSGIFARPEMLGHDPFVLDWHFITGERDHAAAVGTMPRIQGKLVELWGFSAGAAVRIAAEMRAPRLGLIGRAVVDFPAHSRAPDKRATVGAAVALPRLPPPSVLSARELCPF